MFLILNCLLRLSGLANTYSFIISFEMEDHVNTDFNFTLWQQK